MELNMKGLLMNLKDNWVFYVLILQPIIDIIAYFNFDSSVTLISFVARTLFLLIFTLYVFIKTKEKKKYILSLLPFVIVILLHIFNCFRLGYVNFFEDIRCIVRVFQFPVYVINFIHYFEIIKQRSEKFKKIFIINSIVILASVLLSIIMGNYENTYYGVGIIGWFSSANTQTMIMIAILPLFLFYASKSENKILYVLSYISVFFLLYVNATRGAYITLLATFVVMIYILFVQKNKDKFKIGVAIFFFLLSVIGYNFSFTNIRQDNAKINIKEHEDQIDKEEIEMTDEDREKLNDILVEDISSKKKEQIIFLYNFYYYRELIDIFGYEKVLNQMEEKLEVEYLIDNRLRKRVYAKIIWDDSDFFTKLVGIDFGQIDKHEMDMENDLTAIFYCYGYLGFAVYMAFILYFIVYGIKRLFKDKRYFTDGEFVILMFSICLLLFGSEYTGAFLRKPNANLYLALIIAILYTKLKKEEKTTLK